MNGTHTASDSMHQRGIAQRLKIISVVFAVLISVLAGGLVLQALASRHAAERVVTEMIKPESAARDLVAAIDRLNVRLLGIIANIYSAPGSVDRVRTLAAELSSAHSTLATLAIPVDPALQAAAAKATAGVPKLVQDLVPMLQAGRRIAPVYEEDWIDIQTPLVKYAEAVSQVIGDQATGALVETTNRANLLLSAAVLAGVLGLAIAGFVARYVTQRVGQPLVATTRAVASLSSGDYSVAIEGAERSDEIGAIARALIAFRDQQGEMAAFRAERDRDTAERLARQDQVAAAC